MHPLLGLRVGHGQQHHEPGLSEIPLGGSHACEREAGHDRLHQTRAPQLDGRCDQYEWEDPGPTLRCGLTLGHAGEHDMRQD